MFKRRRFPVEIILVCVRWYCKYEISYRDLAEMMQERGVESGAIHNHAAGTSLRA
jgi:IS6 family transposase